MSKVIYSGLESSGKSLRLAMKAEEIVDRNAKWYRETKIVRPILSNLKFSASFEAYASSVSVPIYYWSNLDELIKWSDCDVFIDEVGTYFDARMWQDLSLDVRRWIAMGAKQGIEMYGTAQDFAQVDKAFRRLTNELLHITKLVGSRRPTATRPPVKRIWGICLTTALNPREYNEDKNKFDSADIFSFGFFYIRREFCEIFDTKQVIARSAPPPLRHVDRSCENDLCGFHKLLHV